MKSVLLAKAKVPVRTPTLIPTHTGVETCPQIIDSLCLSPPCVSEFIIIHTHTYRLGIPQKTPSKDWREVVYLEGDLKNTQYRKKSEAGKGRQLLLRPLLSKLSPMGNWASSCWGAGMGPHLS
jgi:hypothetical protein